MIFLNSVLLGLLAAAGIPLLIHLLNPRQRRLQPLATLRFLHAIQSTRLRRLSVKRWLLLLLRTLIVILLVLAFARPALKQGLIPGAAREAVHAVLLFDNSLSTRGGDGRNTAFENQLKDLEALLAAGSADDRYSLLLLAGPAHWLTPLPVDRDALRSQLRGITPAFSGDELRPALELAVARLAQGGALRELHLFSDGRVKLAGDSLGLELPGPLSLWWHHSASPESDRPLPRTTQVNTLILKEGVPVELECALILPASDPGGGVTLSMGDTPVAFREREPGENPVLLRFSAPGPGEHRMSLQVGGPELGELGLARAVLEIPSQIRVLLVSTPGPTSNALAAALRPGEAYGRAIALDRVAPLSLEYTNLADCDLLVVSGPDKLTPAGHHALEQAVRSGKGLVILPDPGEPDLQAFSRLSQDLGLPAVAGVKGPGNWRMGSPDLAHPLFHGLLEPGREPRSPSFLRVLQLAGPDSARTVIPLADGSPLLLERRLGEGRVLLFTSSPAEGWSDLAHSGLFAPLMNRICFYLTRESGAAGGSLVCGASHALGSHAWPAGELRLDGPDGTRLLESMGRGGPLLPPLAVPGFYSLIHDGDTLRTLALTPDFQDLARAELGAEELDRWSGRSWNPAPTDPARFGDERRGREIWRSLLVAALVLLGLEMWLARGRGAEDKGETQ
ncbi:MAG: BatA domain-containing protein [Calditrichaeota bacterium]|nr:BatA domain-containing protein [Calditrichota bacterium]